MVHSLPKLKYKYSDFEPRIDARTMELHHSKHHQAYVDKLNSALEDAPELADRPLEELLARIDDLPEQIQEAVRNHGGGHANHSFLWETMKPGGEETPGGLIGDAIEKQFGSFEKFKERISGEALGVFGSGWAWLALGKQGLEAIKTHNQDSPASLGKKPLFGIDVWEHAYYLKHQNRRKDYIEDFFRVIDWQKAEDAYSKAREEME